LEKQKRLDEHRREVSDSKPVGIVNTGKSGRTIDINIADFKSTSLWTIFLETARSNPLYAGNVAYVKEYILPTHPNINAKELANKLSITVGEALAILEALLHQK
jgi:hypothetical protein